MEKNNVNLSAGIRRDMPLPLYYKTKEEIRRKILAKEWKAGRKIPSETEICQMFSVSRTTARKALEELQQEGYLVKKQGRGTFVQGEAISHRLDKFYTFGEALKSIGIKETAKVLDFRQVMPDDEVRAKLGLGAGESVFWIKRIRCMDESPYTIEQSYIPVKYAPDLTGEMVQKNGLYKSLSVYGYYPNYATETFQAVNLTKEEGTAMQVDYRDAAIQLSRTAYSGSYIVEYCKSVVRGDVFHYTVELK